MINEENLNEIYEATLKGEVLKTNQLNRWGLNSHDLKKLVENESLMRLKRGYYSLKTVDQLYLYGKKLINNREFEKAKICFKKCLEIDGNFVNAAFQLFIEAIRENKYDEAFKYLDILYNSSDNYLYRQDCNLYLYLLNNITLVPDRYLEYVKNLQFSDLKIKGNKPNFVLDLQNSIRKFIYYKKFNDALIKSDELLKLPKTKTIRNILIKRLIIKAKAKKVEDLNYLKTLIQNEEYAKIKTFYENSANYQETCILDKYIIILVDLLLKMNKTGELPKLSTAKSDDVFEAINNGNYGLALSLSKNYDKNKSVIYLLLEKIVLKIKTLKKEIVIKEANKDLNAFYRELLMSLRQNNLDQFLIMVKEFLRKINKPQYEFLVKNIITISFLNSDDTFKELWKTLNIIEKKSNPFNRNYFVQKFYKEILNKRQEVAKIYFNILEGANQNLNLNLNIEFFKSLLEQPNFNFQESPFENNLEEEKMIRREYENLIHKEGVTLLKEMTNNELLQLIDIVEKYNYLDYFLINVDCHIRMVLRYNPYVIKTVAFDDLISLGDKTYQEKNYRECINIYKHILKTTKFPNLKTFSRLGLAYLQTYQYDLAIEYLTIANAISQMIHAGLDYTNLIIQLKGDENAEDYKPHIKDQSFNFDEEYYGLANFEEINNYILTSQLDVESACQNLHLSLEDIDLIKLIYAKMFYQQGSIKQGDLFLKSFERSNNKTSKTKNIYQEIKNNLKLYKNKKSDSMQLSLLLKPSK